MDAEREARHVERSCDRFLDVFWYFGVPRLWSLYYMAGLSWEEAGRRLVTCRTKVIDSLWHWIQQDRLVNLDNITFLQRHPQLRLRAAKQRYVCPHLLPPSTILLKEICHLGPPDYIILEFFRDFNRLLTTRNDQNGRLNYSAFLSVTLCCVEVRRGNKVMKTTWGGSVPLPKHLRNTYIKYAARWFWHPIVSLPVLLSLDETEEGEGTGKVAVAPVNPPILSCRTFQFHQSASSECQPGVWLVPPCRHCATMFPPHHGSVGYVQYASTPLDDASPNWCRGNCAESAAFGEMFNKLKQKCRVSNGNGKQILAKYRMDRMRQAGLVT